jgi:hypothetical protein
MTEVKKTLAILKSRWPEVVLIIVIYFLSMLSSPLITELRPKLIKTLSLVISFLSLLFLLIQTLLRCGFLRTIYLEGPKRQSPFTLLRIGMHFLWRMFVLYLIYILPFFLSLLIFSKSVGKYISSDKVSSSHTIYWFSTLYPVFVNSVLIKLILLIPALIIVLDCAIFDSFGFIRQYKLLNAKELVLLYFVNIAIGLLESIFSFYYWGTTCSTTQSQYTLIFIFSLITSFISLMIAVMAVRFVASQNLVYDSKKVEDSRT